MSGVALKKEDKNNVTVVKKLRNYTTDPAFKKKAEKAAAFLNKHGLPKAFTKKKK